MTLSKRIISIFLICLMVMPFWVLNAFAYDEDWVFIDGENITRQNDTAMIYIGVETTGQNKWGYEIVVNSNGEVIDTHDSGSAEGANLAVPEGGFVISASGTKAKWFEKNISVGNTVFYDGYTQRLFVRDYYGNYDPYFEKSFSVVDQEGEFVLLEGDESAYDDYRYKLIVDENGIIIARNSDIDIPEGGFVVSAASKNNRNNLIMYGIVGAECVVKNNQVTFEFSEDMLPQSAFYAVKEAEAKFEKAKEQYAYIDGEQLAEVLSEYSEKAPNISSYRRLSGFLKELGTKFGELCNEKNSYELRSAFHIPTEKNLDEVNATVLSAKNSGLNSIILRVSNGFNTCIPMPKEFRFKQNSDFNNFDVLQAFIDACERENVSLTVCVDTYYNEYASIAAPEWLSATNGSEKGLSEKYFSPASREFQSYFLEYVDYIITYYNINSIMFDYLRYPKFNENSDLGYDGNTLNRFSEEKQIPYNELEDLKTNLTQSKHWDAWVEFRIGLIDNMAESISQIVREKRSDITLLAVAERDVTDYYYMQNAINWVENGWFDGLAVAVFEADSDENDKLPENAYYGNIVAEKTESFVTAAGDKGYIFPILETSASLDASALEIAINDSRKSNSDGFVFGKLSDYISQNYHIALKSAVLNNDSVSALNKPEYAIDKILEDSKSKVNILYSNYGICDEAVLTSFNGLIDNMKSDLENGLLTYEKAESYYNEIEDLFLESPAKDTILNEFNAIGKIAKLAKSNYGEYQPPEKPVIEPEPEPDNSEGEESKEETLTSDNSAEETSVQSDRIEINIDFGKILIYVFVGITFIAVVAAMVVGIRRKKERPANSHMPRGYNKDDK